jgi:hypothetical protein
MSGNDVPSPGTPPTGGDPGYDAVIEDILAGRLGHGPEDEMSLVGLVDALRAPGSDEELGDLDAATAAFVSARSGAATAAGPAVVVPLASRRAGRAAVAVAAVLGGVVLLGGTAAAATGHLPPVLQDAVHAIIPAFPSAAEAEAAQQAELTSSSSAGAGDSSSSSRPTTPPSRPAGVVDPIRTTDPNRFGQCTAYFNRATASMDSVAYLRLKAAADQAATTVDEWCHAFAPGTGPGKPAPTTTPSASGSSNGHGKPSSVPSGSGANNSGGNGNGNGNGNGATNAATPSKKPTKSPRQPSSPGKPATPGSQGNGKPSSTP